MLATLAIFFASSAVCAAARTMAVLILGRAAQGLAGGGSILLVHVCIADLFSLRERSLFMGFTEGIWALAGGVGPVLGGVFASLASWRWCCEFFFFEFFFFLFFFFFCFFPLPPPCSPCLQFCVDG